MGTALLDPVFPEMDSSSAVYPTVRTVGEVLHLAYYLPGCTDSAVVTFNGVSSWDYGEPNDEGLHNHPLWGHGLTFYGFHKVMGSGDQHENRWVATFHDGTFEVSATGMPTISAARVKGYSPAEALNEILGRGENKVLDEVA
jgi:hypothetical protein